MPLVEEDDLVVAQVAAEPDRLGGLPGDPGDLLARLLDRRGGVDPEEAALAEARVRV